MAKRNPDGVFYRTCPLCEATCGLEIRVADGAVSSIRGDAEDVFSGGFLCPKGATLKHLHEDPDRLKTPMIRGEGGFREATWEEAFAEVERGLPPIVDESGRNAVGVYLGNANVHNMAGTFYMRPLLKSLGTRNLYTASTVDGACGVRTARSPPRHTCGRGRPTARCATSVPTGRCSSRSGRSTGFSRNAGSRGRRVSGEVVRGSASW